MQSCQATTPTEQLEPPNPQTRAEWKSLIQWPSECDDGVSHITSVAPSFVGVESYTLKSGLELVSVVCKTAAYNQGEMVFLKDANKKSHYVKLTFPQFAAVSAAPSKLRWPERSAEASADKHEPKENHPKGALKNTFYQFSHPLLWGNLRIEIENNKIIVDNFYRGGGGCGISTAYKLTKASPTVSASIVALKIKDQCDEVDLSADSWPTIPPNYYQQWPLGDAVER